MIARPAERVPIEVEGHDDRAVLQQPLDDGTADSASSAGDHVRPGQWSLAHPVTLLRAVSRDSSADPPTRRLHQ